jgi:hypothetical protein
MTKEVFFMTETESYFNHRIGSIIRELAETPEYTALDEQYNEDCDFLDDKLSGIPNRILFELCAHSALLTRERTVACYQGGFIDGMMAGIAMFKQLLIGRVN